MNELCKQLCLLYGISITTTYGRTYGSIKLRTRTLNDDKPSQVSVKFGSVIASALVGVPFGGIYYHIPLWEYKFYE